jgi:FkbM family methyltransferase
MRAKNMVVSLAKSILHQMGVDVKRLSPLSNETLQTVQIIRNNQFDVVFDVGANNGQFGRALRQYGYNGRIVSFEPLRHAHGILARQARGDRNWAVHRRCALGNEASVMTIHVASNSASSSLLNMNQRHVDAAPYSAYCGAEEIEVLRLDSILDDYLVVNDRAFLKIDTQGFERQVLEGIGTRLSDFHGILVEMSLVELYDGQSLWLELMSFLQQQNFVLWSLNPGFVDPLSLQTLQIDGIFLKIP